MKFYTLGLFFAATAGSLLAVEIGDTYEKVVQEKGAPATKMDAGGVTVMKYQDVTIKLRDGKVFEVRAVQAKPPTAKK